MSPMGPKDVSYPSERKYEVQSSSIAGNDASKLSSTSVDISGWYTIGTHGTLMATLLENNIYSDTDLFYSTNLQKVDYSQFYVPWFYRSEARLKPTSGSHFQLKTNGITSKADIYLNGMLIADKNTQAGAYAGRTYDITSHIKEGSNVLLIRVYPTDYNRDFALGFVDWNPYPPDNGTGIWRNVEIRQTGPISISAPRIVTKLDGQLSIHLDAQNLDSKNVQGEITCRILSPQGKQLGHPRAAFHLPAKSQQKVTTALKIPNPQLWWPKQWGPQPLYTISCTVSTPFGPSDTTPPKKFGIRTVTSTLNSFNDTTFHVNGHPFQVLGAGYTSDIFLRFSESKLASQLKLVLDMGLNTIRLEGKQEHPYLYELADELGLMIMAGWECCDKWEGWTYNDEGSGVTWTDPDYAIANTSMQHEAQMMQSHPSMLAFLVGSDFWPDDRATKIYLSALRENDWDVPIIASASQRGYPEALGNGGMKMDGPYDWVPPNYWYGDQLGAAFGFGSELGAGVGTPELSSLKKFLSPSDLEDLWKTESMDKGLFHMSTNVSSFYTRSIYNDALWKRYGAPTSLSDYLLKSQMMDYEATKAQYEAYAAKWSAERPATGSVYWMLNNAWPSLHWNLFDYYLHTGGSYFGAKVGSRVEHVAYEYTSQSIYLINRSLSASGARTVEIELLDLDGKVISRQKLNTDTQPNSSKKVGIVEGVDKIQDVALLRLLLKPNNNSNEILSRNVYWLAPTLDGLDWENSTWYYTPVTSYANYTALSTIKPANISVKASKTKVVLENRSKIPAVFVRLNLIDAEGKDIVPVFWEDNYITLWPGEKLDLAVSYESNSPGARIQVSGKNIAEQKISIGSHY
ncbi:glycoside hydrolase superfamily [Lophiotrema nucula]|uniref:Glycoside hydrolase superfamily n=1 Tax=Lophiotrema nucula TaxID=690887 RepID=A0A6A5YIP5_9PLEO|nr:glycoside hydrolase superfamily [Lophiotrema nucula]